MTHASPRRIVLAGLTAALTVAMSAAAVSAHPHTVNGKPIANSQNHPPFISGSSCESFGGTFGPAWFGLETAHHGPDAGDPGKDDGCYRTTGGVAPGLDVQNPVIR